MKSTSYTLAFAFTSAVSFIFLFLAVGMVPYWQELSGVDIQSWWSDPFTNFPPIMVPIHLISIFAMIYAFAKHRKGGPSRRSWWIVSLISLLACQVINFTLHGAVFNPALQSGSLSAAEALETFDEWVFYHNIRTVFACISLTALIVIGSSKDSTS